MGENNNIVSLNTDNAKNVNNIIPDANNNVTPIVNSVPTQNNNNNNNYVQELPAWNIEPPMQMIKRVVRK